MARLPYLLTLSFSLICNTTQAASLSDLSGATVTIKNAPIARALADRLHDQPNLLDYGAVCDTQVLRWTEVSIAAGTTNLNMANGWFEAKDAGKLIVIAGAGAKGDNLATRIVSVQSKSQVILADPALATVNNHHGYVAYGTDDAPAINALLVGRSDPSWDLGELHLPHGVCGVGSTIALPGGHNAGVFGHGQISL